MKKIITIVTLMSASTIVAAADFHPSTYDWNNDATTVAVSAPVSMPILSPVMTDRSFTDLKPIVPSRTVARTAYNYRDNGFFGYNSYSYMDPRWMMQEMSNAID